MKSSNLRRLAQAAASEGSDAVVWNAIAERCTAFAEQLNYWDALHILQSFTDARVENRPLLMHMAEALSAKTSRLAPKHVLDLFAVYEAHELRPRGLYVELFHSIVRLSRAMYPEEISLTLQAMARYEIANPTVVAQLTRALLLQLRNFRLRYLCVATGALGAIHACQPELMARLDEHARFEVETAPVQELLSCVQAFPSLEFSWRPYERLCLEQLAESTRGFENAEDMDQFADPFQAMCFLQARGLLHRQFLEALCQWCLRGVHRPNVRSERRPTARQLLALHDRCREHDLDSLGALEDAIQHYVESGAGKWPHALPKPLKYHKRRTYIVTEDPLKDIVQHELLDASRASKSQPRRSAELDLFGLPSSEAPNQVVPLAGVLGRSRHKPSAPAPGLSPEETTVRCRAFSRKGPRKPDDPSWRHRRDPGLKRMLRTNMHRAPYWYQGGWWARPKYHQGCVTWRYPWPGAPIGRSGGMYIRRK